MSDQGPRSGKSDERGLAARLGRRALHVLGAGPSVTEAAKAKTLAYGIDGRATILRAPGRRRITEVADNVGRFTVRVELPGEEPYETKVWQAFLAKDWERLQPGARVGCKADPRTKRVLLEIPEAADDAPPPPTIEGATLDLRGLFRRGRPRGGR